MSTSVFQFLEQSLYPLHVASIPTWGLLCEIPVDLERLLVGLAGVLRPVLVAMQSPQVVQRSRDVRQVGSRSWQLWAAIMSRSVWMSF